jgi:hypothetical protein
MQKIKFDKKTLILPFIAILVFISAPLYKDISKEYIDNTLSNAVITYATLRGLNAGVSVLQESSITLGIGVEGNIAIGQALDPINDAIERFSDMLTLSLWVLGSEKAIFELTESKFMYIFLAIIAFSAIFIKNSVLNKILIVLILIRLFIPFSAMISYYVNQDIFNPQIEKSLKVLNYAKDKKVNIEITNKNSGIWGDVKNSVSNVSKSVYEFKNAMQFYISNSTIIINELINLSILYFGKFLLNLILLPLFFVYIIKNIEIKL